MTPYELKTNVRSKVILVIALTSLFIGNRLFYFFNDLLTSCPQLEIYISKWEYLGVIPSQITVAIVFGIIKWFFTNYLWKLNFVTKLCDVPNLNGKCEGVLISSYIDSEGNPTELEMVLDIQQTWEKIRCVSTFDKSRSACDMVCIDTTSPEGVLLKFTYVNKSQDATYGIPQYAGYNELLLTEKTLVGQYFTARIPPTCGRIYLTRKGPDTEINQDVTSATILQ